MGTGYCVSTTRKQTNTMDYHNLTSCQPGTLSFIHPRCWVSGISTLSSLGQALLCTSASQISLLFLRVLDWPSKKSLEILLQIERSHGIWSMPTSAVTFFNICPFSLHSLRTSSFHKFARWHPQDLDVFLLHLNHKTVGLENLNQ